MRSALVLLAVAMLILSACAPVAAPTATVPPAPNETPAPSATPAPTATPTRTPTATPTPIPTLPPEQVGGLEGVPDPRVINPELFDLKDPNAPIPQLVNALKNAGIESVTAEEVASSLTFEYRRYQRRDEDGNPVVDAQGNPVVDEYVFGVWELSADVLPERYRELAGKIPVVMMRRAEDGNWEVNSHRVLPLRVFADHLGIKISNLESHYDRSLAYEVSTLFNSWLITWYQKWDLVQPSPNRTNYHQLDKYVRTAKTNGIQPLGGPIIYFYELPDWVKNDNLSDQQLEQIIRSRVRDLVSQYKEDIRFWIVVNEYRDTPYESDYLYKRLGRRYVEIAFDEARKAAPEAILVYNDNSNETPNGHWFQHTYMLVKHLKEKGLINGVGMQMHLNQPNWTDVPSKVELREAIRAFRQLGLEVYITEMDVVVSAKPEKERFLYQADVYYSIIKTYIEETNGQTTQIINIFGLRDNESWYREVLNVPNADPLLFDNNGEPKLSYYAILKLLYEQISAN